MFFFMNSYENVDQNATDVASERLIMEMFCDEIHVLNQSLNNGDRSNPIQAHLYETNS